MNSTALAPLPSVRLLAVARYADVLQELQRGTQGVQSATLASADGLTVVSTLAQTQDADKISAMAGSLSALAGALTREVGHADAERLILETNAGRILTMAVSSLPGALVLAVVTDPSSLLGKLLWSCRTAVEQIALIQQEMPAGPAPER